MNTITRGSGRRAALTAAALAVVALGLAGCQAAAVDRTTEDSASIAQQVARSSAASQARYEGLADHYAQHAQGPDVNREVAPLRIVPDRLEQAMPQPREVTQLRVLADRLDPQPTPDDVGTEQTPRIVPDRLVGME
ncbi:hypothetical protein [Microbacterium sp. HJ5]